MKKIIVGIIIGVVIIIIIVGAYFLFWRSSETTPVTPDQNVATSTPQATATSSQVLSTVIGKSVQKRDIVAYHYGTGEKELLFIGGIHGGYEWNTVLVAYDLIDYLSASSTVIPKNIKVTVIPVLNPDGLNKVVGTTGRFTKADVSTSKDISIAGRFNANNVDLNRNFDCDWQSKGVWQETTVSGGDKAFSEPESQAIKSYIEKNKPAAAVVWYSAIGGVFSSECNKSNVISTETNAINKIYATASGYKSYDTFNFYETSGDMVNWFAKIGIPAISVLLTTHEDVEWNKNQASVDALLKYYTTK